VGYDWDTECRIGVYYPDSQFPALGRAAGSVLDSSRRSNAYPVLLIENWSSPEECQQEAAILAPLLADYRSPSYGRDGWRLSSEHLRLASFELVFECPRREIPLDLPPPHSLLFGGQPAKSGFGKFELLAALRERTCR